MAKELDFDVYAIVLDENKTSAQAFDTLVRSSREKRNAFEVRRFPATKASDVGASLRALDLRWNYPLASQPVTFENELVKTPYKTSCPDAVIGCALSHYRLWRKSAREKRAILVLEHDALFLRKVPIDFLLRKSPYGVLGINSPLRATRKASSFHKSLRKRLRRFSEVPWVDSPKIPQGLPGNSAYLLKPSAAVRLLELVNRYGLWPNDAIMCKQLLPGELGSTRTYYTTTQNGIPSTTRQAEALQ